MAVRIPKRFLWVDSLPKNFSGANPAKHLLSDQSQLNTKKYDALVVGAGHNGLIAGTYLAKQGKKVAILEKRHVIGGAAVTEELVPGFHFSRASYLLALMRPEIIQELNLKQHGLKWFVREPHAFTPLLDDKRYLLLGSNEKQNMDSIAQFSKSDAQKYAQYNNEMEVLADAITHVMTALPVDDQSRFKEKISTLNQLRKLAQEVGWDFNQLHEVATAPMSKVLNKWFESEPLKACLATDAVIGAMLSPDTPGSGYVLLHHVMGGVEGHKGAWAYVEGGMGGVSLAIAKAFKQAGGDIYCETPVNEITVSNGSVQGVKLESGKLIGATNVLANPTPQITFEKLIKPEHLPAKFLSDIKGINYDSPVTKFNIAVDRLPNFSVLPNKNETPQPHHFTTIHLNCESMDDIDKAYQDCVNTGEPSKKPIIEMTVPSVLDKTISPEGKHVIGLFTQYCPIKWQGKKWTDEQREAYTNCVLDSIENYAPGFKSSILGIDILTPQDIEAQIGLTGGNIFHGSMSLDQLFIGRPSYRSPISGLYLCGSGAHPGGGVMGLPGKHAAQCLLND